MKPLRQVKPVAYNAALALISANLDSQNGSYGFTRSRHAEFNWSHSSTQLVHRTESSSTQPRKRLSTFGPSHFQKHMAVSPSPLHGDFAAFCDQGKVGNRRLDWSDGLRYASAGRGKAEQKGSLAGMAKELVRRTRPDSYPNPRQDKGKARTHVPAESIRFQIPFLSELVTVPTAETSKPEASRISLSANRLAASDRHVRYFDSDTVPILGAQFKPYLDLRTPRPSLHPPLSGRNKRRVRYIDYRAVKAIKFKLTRGQEVEITNSLDLRSGASKTPQPTPKKTNEEIEWYSKYAVSFDILEASIYFQPVSRAKMESVEDGETAVLQRKDETHQGPRTVNPQSSQGRENLCLVLKHDSPMKGQYDEAVLVLSQLPAISFCQIDEQSSQNSDMFDITVEDTSNFSTANGGTDFRGLSRNISDVTNSADGSLPEDSDTAKAMSSAKSGNAGAGKILEWDKDPSSISNRDTQDTQPLKDSESTDVGYLTVAPKAVVYTHSFHNRHSTDSVSAYDTHQFRNHITTAFDPGKGISRASLELMFADPTSGTPEIASAMTSDEGPSEKNVDKLRFRDRMRARMYRLREKTRN